MRALTWPMVTALAAFVAACQQKKQVDPDGSEDPVACADGDCYGPSDAVPATQPGNQPGGGGGPPSGAWTPANPPADKPTPFFKVTEGTTIATINIRAGLGNVQGVTKIDIRGALGDKAPATCAQGTLIHSATSKLHAVSYTDSSWPDEIKSYRACFYRGANIAAESVVSSVRPRAHHKVFVSSAAYTGDLRQSAHDHQGNFATAKDGADYRCQYLAKKAGFSGHWSALITTGTGNDRAHHHRILGGIYNNKPQRQRAALSRADLWSSGGLAVDVNADEFGRAVTGGVWTGTSDSGAWLYSCGGFTANTGTGTFGNPDARDVTWLASGSGSCGEARHLYCIDRVPDQVAVAANSALTVAPSQDAASVDVGIQLAADTAHIGAVRIYGLDGNQDPGRPLSCDNPDFHEQLVRAYTADPRDLYESPISDAFTFQYASDGYYSHRMCVWDLYGNLISEHKQAAVLTSGSQPEDFHHAFVVGGLTGDLGGVSGADDHCQNAAAAAGLTDRFPAWKALLSASSEAARDRLAIHSKVYVVNGQQLYALSADELFSTSGPRSGIKHAADGTFAGSTDAWTGATPSGGSSAEHCRDWTSDSPDDKGTVGYADIHGQPNISAGQNRCYLVGGLICISQ